MSHAVRHVARRIARAVATSTPRTRTPVAETGARPRPFSRGADGSPARPGAPLGVAPPGAPSPSPGPRGPGDGERREGFVSWPGLAFLIAAPVAYYLSGGFDDVGEEAHRPVQASATKESSARKPPAADASKPEQTKATTPKEETRAEATEEEEEDIDVFRAAAELLARNLDPAPEGAEKRVEESKAERKERRRAEKRARREADRRDGSGASGPAGAARARALANRPDLSEEDEKEEDGAEAMTAAALVTRAFEGAVEVRPRTSTQTFPLASPASFFSLHCCYTQPPRPHTMSRRSFHAARTTRRGAPLAQFSARPAAPRCLMPADSPRSAGA